MRQPKAPDGKPSRRNNPRTSASFIPPPGWSPEPIAEANPAVEVDYGSANRSELVAQAAQQHPLHDAACLGKVSDVEALIQAGADRERPDAFGRTVVHMAAALGHEAVIRMLSRLGAKLEVPDAMGSTPLHIAAHAGQIDVMRALMELRADVNAVQSGRTPGSETGRTPFHLAVDGVQPRACKLLPRMNANLEARDSRNDTPLTLAVRLGHTLVLDSLIDQRCDLHARDDDGSTPLHLAACKQRLECIEILVMRGARAETTDKHGFTPLHVASRSGEPEAVAKLIQMKANVMARTTAGRQLALHLAAMADELETIDVLYKFKADIDAQDTRGYASLHCAVEYDRINSLTKLLQFGALRDQQTRANDTALHLACQAARPHLVERLLRNGSNVNARGRNGQTALHMASEIGSMSCAVAILDDKNRFDIKNPVNPSAPDQAKQTPLHIAAWHGRVELCDLLIQSAAEVDLCDSEDCTPLSLAITKDHDMTVRTLLRLQADPMRRNAQELAPLQLACVSGALAVAKTLASMKLLPGPDEPPWRRPMALANFYGHKEVSNFFFQPVPKNRLMLNMARAVSTTVITVTMTPISTEPVCTSAQLHCIVRPQEGWRTRRHVGGPTDRRPSVSSQETLQGRQPFDPFVLATELVAERVLEEEEWMNGKTIQISGLEPNSGYLVRLIAGNDAGFTHGDIVEIVTKAPKDSAASATDGATRRGKRNVADREQKKGVASEADVQGPSGANSMVPTDQVVSLPPIAA